MLTMLYPSRIYIARGLWYFQDYCKIFLPNIGENQKNLIIWARASGTVSCGKSGPDYCIAFL